tara:strand:- start:8660 stop:9388 length:729 start_codon:yes stop_codon:yes gene_type:complete
MSSNQKQYSSYHFLPTNVDEFVTILPRKLLKNDYFIENFDVRNELPLFCFITTLLLNEKNNNFVKGDSITIKYSTLRNFLRKKCHSEKKEYLDEVVIKFFNKLKNNSEKIFFNIFKVDTTKVEISFSKKYLKLLEKNTVSFNLYNITKTRGVKAKKLFLKIISYDMRDKNQRFFTLKSISKYLDLDCFLHRKKTIRTIKRAFKSLSLKSLITSMEYIGINKNDIGNNYRFVYKLGILRQQTI